MEANNIINQMLNRAIVLCLLAGLALSSCSEGCLKCVNDKCEICDLTRFYYYDESVGCKLNKKENCKVGSLSPTSVACFMCDPGYFLNQLINECSPVIGDKKDENCESYSPVADCVRCKQGYVVSLGKCLAPSTKIAECQFQLSEASCSACNSGYSLNQTKSLCQKFETTENCLYHQNFICNKCKDGFTLGTNFLLLSRMTLDLVQNSLQENSTNASLLTSLKEDCKEKKVPNCAEFNSYGLCSLCNETFHVDSNTGLCVLSPEPEIYKCKEYTSVSDCKECIKGYYMTNNTCVERKDYPNCDEYKKGTDGCAKCDKDYYIVGSSCTIRKKSLQIEHCAKNTMNADTCEECNEGMIKATDALKCFFKLKFCKAYRDVDSAGTLYCLTCDNSTIPQPTELETTSCDLRTNFGCKEFKSDHSNECITCHPDFFLEAPNCTKRTNKCKEYKLIEDKCESCHNGFYKTASFKCERYSVRNCNELEDNKNECTDCKPGFYKELIFKECLPYNLLNCLNEATNENKCNTCKPGFYKANDTTCLKKDLWGCADPNSTLNKCTTCMAGFYKDGRDLCRPHNSRGCTLAGMSKVSSACTACHPGFYFEDPECLPVTVRNCLTPSTTSNQCTASGCDPGYLFSAGKCLRNNIPNCQSLTSAGVCAVCQQGYYKQGSFCFIQYSHGCKVFAGRTNLNCTECFEGFHKPGNDCIRKEIDNCKKVDQATGNCSECAPNFAISGASCVKMDTIGCKTYSAVGVCTAAFTPYYKMTGDDPVRLTPNNCAVPDAANGKCTTCMPNYYSNNGDCELNETENCVEYSSNGNCSQCINLFYANTGCSPITAADKCFQSDGTANTCTKCLPGNYDSSGTCTVSTADEVLNCEFNTGTTVSAKCTNCKVGHSMLAVESLAGRLPDYCASVDNSFACTQLEAGWEVKSGTKVRISDKTSKCIQLIAGEEVAIGTAAKCKKCRDNSIHYLTGGNCTDRSTSLGKCSIYDPVSDACIACNAGLKYHLTAASQDCTEDHDPTASDTTYCLVTKPGGGCYRCKTSHSVNSEASNMCVINPANLPTNCRVYKTSTATVCDVCLKDYGLGTDKKCYTDDNCFRNSTTQKCSVCHENYIPGADPYNCVPNKHSTDCLFFSTGLTYNISKPYCTRCKDPAKVPINQTNQGSATLSTFRCVDPGRSELLGMAILHSGSTFYARLDVIPTDRLIVNPAAQFNSINLPQYYCFSLEIDNCEVYDTNNKIMNVCTQCKRGYYRSANSLDGEACLVGGISGCDIYATSSTCSKCRNGYKKNASNLCDSLQIIKNCKLYDVEAPICQLCKKGFVEVGGQCEEDNRKNCVFNKPGSNACMECEEGFFVKEDKCEEYTVRNCITKVRNLNWCSLCEDGFYNKEGECLKNSSLDCKLKSRNQDNCIACEENFYIDLVTGNCKELTEGNCKTYNMDDGNCLICEDDHYLNPNGQCIEYLVENCLMRDPERDECLSCGKNYFSNHRNYCIEYSVENCRVFRPNNNFCAQCEEDYFTSQLGLCFLYKVRNCLKFNPKRDECETCPAHTYRGPNKDCLAYKNMQNCKSMDPNVDRCTDCLPGNFMTLGRCESYTVSNCANLKGDEDVCLSCERGFYLADTGCQHYTIDCEHYNPFLNRCLSCQEGFYLEDGVCNFNTGILCKEFSQFANGCSKCDSDFYLKRKTCLERKKSSNCHETLETADLCLSCRENQYMAAGICHSYAQKTCKNYDKKRDICLSCETDKYWMSNGLCEEYTVLNCQNFDPKSDKCLVCKEGLHYLGGEGICLPSTEVASCSKYNKTANECVECGSGHYRVSGSECRRNPSGMYKCKQYKTENTCMKCEQEYFMKNNACEKSRLKIDNCDTYSEDSKCGKCANGMILLDNPPLAADSTVDPSTRPEKICIAVVETSCAQWTDVDNCKTCPPNFLLQESAEKKQVCVDSAVANCVEAEAASPANKCLKCTVGNILNAEGACNPPAALIDSCKDYKKEGECTECADNFTLSKDLNSCIENYSLMSSNCVVGAELSTPVCKLCKTGHQLDSKNQCTPCGGEGCNVCNPSDSSKCLMCNPGFNHTSSGCIKAKAAKLSRNISGHSGVPNFRFGFVGLVGLIALLIKNF